MAIHRDQVIKDYQKLFPSAFVKPGEDFDGREGDSIWLSAEEPDTAIDGVPIFNYYAMSDRYEIGVLNKFMDWLRERGWYAEWNDPGTIFLYKE